MDKTYACWAKLSFTEHEHHRPLYYAAVVIRLWNGAQGSWTRRPLWHKHTRCHYYNPNDTLRMLHAESSASGGPSQTAEGTSDVSAMCINWRCNMKSFLFKKRKDKEKRKKQNPSDNVFHGSVVLQGFLLHGPEMGKLIVALEQIRITPLDALMSECKPDSLTGWGEEKLREAMRC